MRCHCGRIVSAAWSVTSAGRRPRSRGRWRLLESRCFGTLPELAAAEKINASYVSRVLRLTLLPTALVEAILNGRQPEGMAPCYSSSWRCLPLLDSTPRAYRLRAGNASLASSTSDGTSPTLLPPDRHFASRLPQGRRLAPYFTLRCERSGEAVRCGRARCPARA